MVLESLINPFKAEKNPWELFFLGFFYTSIAITLSLWIFKQQTSLVMVFLTVLACAPLIYSTIKYEEKKSLFIEGERNLLKEHSKAISLFGFLFLGLTMAFAAWYVLLPADLLTTVFGTQTQTILDINNKVTGNVYEAINLFTLIFFNNIKVLVFCILFAFLYGVGAIFILTWNASVIGVAIGNFIRTELSRVSSSVGLSKFSSYFSVISIGLLKYSIHGIPEILAYLVAGLAGGIISVAVIRHDFRTKRFENIVLDSSSLIILSILLLVIAGLLEVFVTPLIF